MVQYDSNFVDENDLIDHLNRGCEVEFLYGNKMYSITHTDHGVSVTEFNNISSEKTYVNAKQAMEYEIDKRKLRDIITDMKVTDRSF